MPIRAAASLLCAIALACVEARAHEIGTTVVTAHFTDARYEITIATDATALAEKLAVVTGTQAPASMDANELASYIRGLDAIVRQRVELSFDDARVAPGYSYQVEPADNATSAAAAIIRLTGALPAGDPSPDRTVEIDALVVAVRARIKPSLDAGLWRAFGRISDRCQRLLRILTADPPPSYDDISETLEMPIGSIGPTRQRCLDRLRAELVIEGIASA